MPTGSALVLGVPGMNSACDRCCHVPLFAISSPVRVSFAPTFSSISLQVLLLLPGHHFATITFFIPLTQSPTPHFYQASACLLLLPVKSSSSLLLGSGCGVRNSSRGLWQPGSRAETLPLLIHWPACLPLVVTGSSQMRWQNRQPAITGKCRWQLL